MKWLTQNQVKEAAEKSRKAALECSRLHWEQLATCTEKEIKQKEKQLTANCLYGAKYCALCERYSGAGCKNCPLLAVGGCHDWGTQYQICGRSKSRGIDLFQVEAKRMEQLLKGLQAKTGE